ncbi:MAG: heliorhodopsin HeR [Patescibacteria group bacterium]|nr:heliorhodopsin HeR [Patescibacteria group bacterium]
MSKITMVGLKKFNLFMGLMHAVQGALMLALSNDFTLPIKTYFVEFDPAVGQLITKPEVIYDLKVGPAVASFLFLSAIAHFSVSLIPQVRNWYEKNLGKGMNLARWIEYSFSSSVMIVIIAMLTGIYSAVALMCIFALNAMMVLFGWMMELHNQTTKKTDWTSFIFGCVAGIVPWIAIALYLGFSGEGDMRAPDFVYWIFFSLFLFFNVFAVNMVLQYKKLGKWQDYLYGERMYIILSLVAKSLLAWQVFAGTLRPV